jgi:metal-responsive CopG/Arc/MetJ family transcriptional regulator
MNELDDKLSHDLQNRIDIVMDMIKEVIPDDGWSLDENQQKLVKVISDLENIRDDMPCSC